MPRITLKENDNTIFNVAQVDSDNIVYVPGSAITGPYDAPVLFGSVSDFTKVFGTEAPATASDNIGTAWDYAYYLLNQGLPVLYRRVVPLTEGGDLDETKVAKARYSVNNSGDTAILWYAEELYGGSFGNKLKIKFEKNSNSTALLLKVYRQTERSGKKYYILMESKKLVSMNLTPGIESNAAYKAALLENFDVDTTAGKAYMQTNYIQIVVNDLEEFTIVPDTTSTLFTGGTDASEDDILPEVAATYAGLDDKFIYDIKFITSGGYVDQQKDIATAMATLAETRGDCVFIADIPYGTDKDEVPDFFNSINSSYGAAYAPWIYFRLSTNITKWMPPSFVFLYTASKYISKTETLWDAPAGVVRGAVAEAVTTEYDISQETLDEWQNYSVQCINPIINIRNYGYSIFGQRTLYQVIDGDENNRASLQEFAVRLTANEVKRLIYNTCIRLTFEQNNMKTWNEFKGIIIPRLESMLANGILNDYSVVMDSTTMTSEDISNNKIKGKVSISVARAAEDFEIGFDLNPSEVSILDQTELLEI